MKKILTFILTIVISILICVLCVSVSIKEIVVNTISKEVVKKEVASEVTNTAKEIYPDMDYDTLEKIETSINNSSTVDEMTEKYFDNIVDAIVNDKEVTIPNTQQEIYDLIDQNEAILKENNIELTEEQKQQISIELTEDGKIDKIYNNVSNKVIDNMSEGEVTLVKTYSAVTNNSFKWIMAGIIIILTVLIALVKKTYYRWTYNLAVSFAIAGILLTLAFPFVVDSVAIDITTKVIGNAADLNVNKVINLGYVCFAISALLIIIYLVGNKVTRYNERKNNY